MATGTAERVGRVDGYQTSAHALIGKRAVVTRFQVELVTPIESGAAAVEAAFNMHRLAHPDEPVSIFFDGWSRKEYGRPLDAWEVERALRASGLA